MLTGQLPLVEREAEGVRQADLLPVGVVEVLALRPRVLTEGEAPGAVDSAPVSHGGGSCVLKGFLPVKSRRVRP
ncbi:hypothetical protein [Streptomyces sp. NBC_01429]|uniref:hypothetical protein n=1 Tax=Streptomyces sp. NBC_01429 TaxID=2903862 RepID=UPI002E27C6C6|nr:hypothetical protein [Streptomyces sp. NBC_01429]